MYSIKNPWSSQTWTSVKLGADLLSEFAIHIWRMQQEIVRQFQENIQGSVYVWK